MLNAGQAAMPRSMQEVVTLRLQQPVDFIPNKVSNYRTAAEERCRLLRATKAARTAVGRRRIAGHRKRENFWD